MSTELREFLHTRGVATSRTTTYNPTGNSKVERYNGIIWKSISLALDSRKLHISQWELVLTDALHSIRSLLSTATNETPHERMFNYNRKSSNGQSLPKWLMTPGNVLLKRQVRSKFYSPVDEVELLHSNIDYAHVKYPDGRETTVSTKHLARPHSQIRTDTSEVNADLVTENQNERNAEFVPENRNKTLIPENNNLVPDESSHSIETKNQPVKVPTPLRRSNRIVKPPDKLGY